MINTNPIENINSPPDKNDIVRPSSAPLGTEEKNKSSPNVARVDSSPGNEETQMPTSTQSDESPPTKK